MAKTPPIEWKVGYTDPFADDKPLFTITAANAEQYKIAYGAGLRADVRLSYFVELGALLFRRGTAYDPVRDRGQYTVTIGYNIQ